MDETITRLRSVYDVDAQMPLSSRVIMGKKRAMQHLIGIITNYARCPSWTNSSSGSAGIVWVVPIPDLTGGEEGTHGALLIWEFGDEQRVPCAHQSIGCLDLSAVRLQEADLVLPSRLAESLKPSAVVPETGSHSVGICSLLLRQGVACRRYADSMPVSWYFRWWGEWRHVAILENFRHPTCDLCW